MGINWLSLVLSSSSSSSHLPPQATRFNWSPFEAQFIVLRPQRASEQTVTRYLRAPPRPHSRARALA